jgi:hypothetical protein
MSALFSGRKMKEIHSKMKAEKAKKDAAMASEASMRQAVNAPERPMMGRGGRIGQQQMLNVNPLNQEKM